MLQGFLEFDLKREETGSARPSSTTVWLGRLYPGPPAGASGWPGDGDPPRTRRCQPWHPNPAAVLFTPLAALTLSTLLGFSLYFSHYSGFGEQSDGSPQCWDAGRLAARCQEHRWDMGSGCTPPPRRNIPRAGPTHPPFSGGGGGGRGAGSQAASVHLDGRGEPGCLHNLGPSRSSLISAMRAAGWVPSSLPPPPLLSWWCRQGCWEKGGGVLAADPPGASVPRVHQGRMGTPSTPTSSTLYTCAASSIG